MNSTIPHFKNNWNKIPLGLPIKNLKKRLSSFTNTTINATNLSYSTWSLPKKMTANTWTNTMTQI